MIQREVWANDIAANLFPDNSFLQRSLDDSAFVEDNKTVHLPQSGAKPNIEVNRTVPAAGANAGLRTDTDSTYDLDSYSSDPTTIRRIEEMEVSYDKRMSVLDDHIGAINESISNQLAYVWAADAAAQIVRTSGGARPAFVSGATGNRKKVTLADILSAKRILDAQDVPQEGRVMVIPSEAYNDLLELDEITNAEKYGRANLPNGAVNRIYGFDIYLRSSVVSYDNATTPVKRAPDATVNVDANAGILCYHERFVRRALGQVYVFTKEDDPNYYGSVFSAEAKAGGRKRYATGIGVVTIVEEHA